MLLRTIIRKLPASHIRFLRRLYYRSLQLYFACYRSIRPENADIFSDINIETTTYCNRRCSYCPNSVYDRSLKKNQKLMSEKLFKQIIDQLAEINFSGRISPHFYGEPLLDSRLVKLMAYLVKKLPNSRLVIYTNGDFLTKDIVRKLYLVGVKNYLVTFHGDSNERERNEKNIRNLQKTGKKNKWQLNIDTLIIDEHTQLSTRAGSVEIKEKRKDLVCQNYASYLLTIDYRGDVLICCNDYLSEVTFGNVGKENIINIWNKPKFKKVRSELKKGIYRSALCKKCTGAEL